MKLPPSTDFPVFHISDDAECLRIARCCGFETDLFRRRIIDYARRTGEPSFGAVTLEHDSKVLVLQFFTGYTHERQNGWSIIGFASAGVYLQWLPQLLQHMLRDAHNISCTPFIPAN